MKRIAVVGGGASGMMAAIAAKNNNTEVTLFELNDRVGKKILATGNGKCNYSNTNIDSSCYNGSNVEFAIKVINKFDREALQDFFLSLGVLSTIKRNGLYPLSGQANTILDSLRNELSYLGVKVITDACITDVKKTDDAFLLSGLVKERKTNFDFDSVILSFGSIASLRGRDIRNHYQILYKLGLDIIEPVPALVQLRCFDGCLKAMAGVRFDGCITVLDNGKALYSEKGEIQLTDYGVSGIPTFQLSGKTGSLINKGKKLQISLDFLPDISKESLGKNILCRKVRSNDQSCEDFFMGLTNKKIILQVMKQAKIKASDLASSLDEKKKRKVAELLKDFRLNIDKSNGFENAQVCAGGLSLDLVNEDLMVSSIPGLYVTGELLDVDGRCGGYNLQWAFSSGYVAGLAAGK